MNGTLQLEELNTSSDESYTWGHVGPDGYATGGIVPHGAVFTMKLDATQYTLLGILASDVPGLRPPMYRTVDDGPIVDAVTASLDSLGDTSDAVAATLGAAGLRGTRADSEDCAIARFVKTIHTIASSGYRAETGGEMTRIYDEVNEVVHQVQHPSVVREFISKFDGMQYPHLIDAYV